MKLIGFLLMLFVGMSGVTHGQIPGILNPKADFSVILAGTQFASYAKAYENGKISSSEFLDSMYQVSIFSKQKNFGLKQSFYKKLAHALHDRGMQSWVISHLVENETSEEEQLKYAKILLKFRQGYLPSKHFDLVRTLNKLGVIQQDIGNWDKALSYYNKALNAIPAYDTWGFLITYVYLNKSNAYIKEKKYRESADVLLELIRLNHFSDLDSYVRNHVEFCLLKIIKNNRWSESETFIDLRIRLCQDAKEKTNFLINLSYSMAKSEFDKIVECSIVYFEKAESEMLKNNYPKYNLSSIRNEKATALMNNSKNEAALNLFLDVKSQLEFLGKDTTSTYILCLSNTSMIYDRLEQFEKASDLRYLFLTKIIETPYLLNYLDFFILELDKFVDFERDTQKIISLLTRVIEVFETNHLFSYSIGVRLDLIQLKTKFDKQPEASLDLLETTEQIIRSNQTEESSLLGPLYFERARWLKKYGINDEYLYFYQKAISILEQTDSTCILEYDESIDELISARLDLAYYGDTTSRLIYKAYRNCTKCYEKPNFKRVSSFLCEHKYVRRKWELTGGLYNYDEPIWSLLKKIENEFSQDQASKRTALKSLWDEMRVVITRDTLGFVINEKLAFLYKNIDNYQYCSALSNMIDYHFQSGKRDLGYKLYDEIKTYFSDFTELEINYFKGLFARDLIEYDVNAELGVELLMPRYDYLISSLGYEFTTLAIPLVRGLYKLNRIELVEDIFLDRETYLIKRYGESSGEYVNYLFWLTSFLNETEDYGKIIFWREKQLRVIKKLYPNNIIKMMEQLWNLADAYIKLNDLNRPLSFMNSFEQEYQINPEKYMKEEININSMLYYVTKALIRIDLLADSSLDISLDEQLRKDFEIQAVELALGTIEILEEVKIKYQKEYGQDSSVYLSVVDFYTETLVNTYKFYKQEISESQYFALVNDLSQMIGAKNEVFNQVFHQAKTKVKDFINSELRSDSVFFYSQNCYRNITEQISDFKKNQLFLTENMSNGYREKLDDLISQFHYLFVYKSFNGIESGQEKSISKYAFESVMNAENLIGSSLNRMGKLIKGNSLLSAKKKELDSLNNFFLFSSDSILSKNELRKQIYDKSIELNYAISEDFYALSWITTADLVESFDKNEVYMDISRYTPKYGEDSLFQNYFVVSIIKHDMDSIEVFTLDQGESLKELAFDYTNRIHGNSTLRKMIDTSGRYYDQFWSPIAKELKGIDKVYISLDGVYNNINLATLYNKESGKYLFEELDIEIVNSARSFIESKNKEPEQYEELTATLIGYPDYDHQSNVKQLDENKTDYYASSRDITSQLTDSLSRGGRVGSLPATKTEVQTIAETLRKQNWTPTTLMESEASEYAVKQLNSPRIVHMATHGYFLEDIEQDQEEDLMLGMDRKKVIKNPMLRSGLLFAGANATLSGKQEPGGENGILTAYEASFLNLENTELVVMSACETAKGEQKTGEGVYGLRKAIADAGAEHVMMSLWKVDDKVTQEFMTTFYTYWLEDKMSIREAFKSTRSFIKSKYPQPYYWGAFILVGR